MFCFMLQTTMLSCQELSKLARIKDILINDSLRNVFQEFLKTRRNQEFLQYLNVWIRADEYMRQKKEIDDDLLDDFAEIDAVELYGTNKEKLYEIKTNIEKKLQDVHDVFINHLQISYRCS